MKSDPTKYHELPQDVYEQLVNPTPTIRYYFLTQFYANSNAQNYQTTNQIRKRK